MGCHRKAPRTLTNVVSPDDLRAVVVSGPHRWRTSLFKERMIYEQSAARTVGEQQENRTCGWSRQPLTIEQWRHPFRCVRKPSGTCQIPVIMGILFQIFLYKPV